MIFWYFIQLLTATVVGAALLVEAEDVMLRPRLQQPAADSRAATIGERPQAQGAWTGRADGAQSLEVRPVHFESVRHAMSRACSANAEGRHVRPTNCSAASN